MGIADRFKKIWRNTIKLTESDKQTIEIKEGIDWEMNCLRNRIWYRGDSDELNQLYHNLNTGVDRFKFWASNSSKGMDIRKIHTGLPSLMVDTLNAVVMADLNAIEINDEVAKGLWDEIEKDNKFIPMVGDAVTDMLYIGDGAFRIAYDTAVSKYPILEWVCGDKVDIVKQRGRVREVVFKTVYHKEQTDYILHETYGYGYIKSQLFKNGKELPLDTIKATENLVELVEFDDSVILAHPMSIYASKKYNGRGKSIFDSKIDNFDSFDEVWSQWMDAVRAGRAKTYVPENLLPRDPRTGMVSRPNPFDNRYIATGANMAEGAKNEISTTQANIPHDSYIASYITALDLCLQGIMSPSTLGIDTKKLDNAEAQREKEKTTLYTRNAIVNALQENLPIVVQMALYAYYMASESELKDVEVNVQFGEYSNPSFESQVETVGKAKQQGIMSVEASVEELYGDTKDAEWKREEVKRLKEEQGVVEMVEPALNLEYGAEFSV